jgi:phage terminase large subunit-like protein
LIPVALALLIVFAGCSGGAGDAAQKADSEADYEESEPETKAQSDDAEYQGQESEYEMSQRELIRTGTVSVRVDSYEDARRNLTQATSRYGGFVSDSSEEVHTSGNRTWTTGKVVLRVPKENFSALLSRAKQAGEVEQADTNTRDVTDKLVDIEARLTNLKAQRDRLRDLYEEANDTENVLAVQERLSEVQSEIERLEAQRKSLKQQVAYSTITVRLHEKRPEPESTDTDEKQWYETGLLSAFASSVHGVEVVLRSLAVAAAYAMPFVLAFGVPLGGGYAVWRRRNRDEVVPERDAEPPSENE